MINYGKNKNVLAGNVQKTIRFAARLLGTIEYVLAGAALGISTDGFETSPYFQQNFTEFRINFLKAQQQHL